MIKNKRINSLFRSDKKKIIHKNKIDSTSSHILKNYTINQIVHLKKLCIKTLY